MPSEKTRITKNKRIKLPGGNEVLFPIIAQITFQDPIDRGQETQFSLDNSSNSDRTIHVAWVGPDGGSDNATEDASSSDAPDDCLAVERIDIFRVIDAIDRGQETQPNPDNQSYDENGPPYFTTHQKTHIIRVLNDPDDGSWIETELIDEISHIDPIDRYQEIQYSLDNPIGEDDGNGNMVIVANPDDAEEDDTGDAIDPPWRIDPFQNIVKFSGIVIDCWFTNVSGNIYTDDPTASDGGCVFDTCLCSGVQNAPPGGSNLIGWGTASSVTGFDLQYQSYCTISDMQGNIIASGDGPLLSTSGASQSFGVGEICGAYPIGPCTGNLYFGAGFSDNDAGGATGTPLLDANDNPITFPDGEAPDGAVVIDNLTWAAHATGQPVAASAACWGIASDEPDAICFPKLIVDASTCEYFSWTQYYSPENVSTIGTNDVGTIAESIVGSPISVVINPAPFEVGGKMYKALGLADKARDTFATRIQIYCVPA